MVPKLTPSSAAWHRNYYATNPKRRSSKLLQAWRSKLRKFGLTPELYGAMLQAQGGTCAVCGRTPKEDGRRLGVDHDHKSGLVRGLLCWWCNKKIIGRHHDSTILKKAVEYLEREKAPGLLEPLYVPDLRQANRKH